MIWTNNQCSDNQVVEPSFWHFFFHFGYALSTGMETKNLLYDFFCILIVSLRNLGYHAIISADYYAKAIDLSCRQNTTKTIGGFVLIRCLAIVRGGSLYNTACTF